MGEDEREKIGTLPYIEGRSLRRGCLSIFGRGLGREKVCIFQYKILHFETHIMYILYFIQFMMTRIIPG